MELRTADDVFDRMDAHIDSAALCSAMELGLFWLLVERPRDTPDIAAALDIPPVRCGHWLRLLDRAGFLVRRPEGYTITPATRSAVLDAYSRETWAFLARETSERFPAVVDLTSHIRIPGSIWAAQGLKPPHYVEQMTANPERAREFTRMLFELHLPLADAVAVHLDLGGVRRMMDLGGGSGVVSLALLRKYPSLSSVVVDIANVCAAGRVIAAENGMADRLTYQPVDFSADVLPDDFDMVLACDTSSFSETVFQKVHGSLIPGGRFVLIDQFAEVDGEAHSSRLQRAFLTSLENPDAKPVTLDEVQARLQRSGFRIRGREALPVASAQRWSRGWDVLDAHKPVH